MSESENPADAADGTARLEATVGRESELLLASGRETGYRAYQETSE